MPKITYITLAPGVSIVNSQCDALVNTVNCVGVMGKGVALAFKQRYPDIMTHYSKYCDEHALRPGMILPWHTPDGKLIFNAATKNHWNASSKFDWIVDILCRFTHYLWQRNHITSLALPPLGCGNGALEWMYVGPVMAGFLEQLPLERIEVYLPQGWEHYHITS